ncbi:FCH-domain-containing protein [Rhizophagus irregularis]|uniref:FCH-domain-containing protein n=1 Tax=Rhizophagus irregularis TaxID=588596 RepID=A0A2I1GGV3_9GLOM|nr:FCH-domain-containing protein [Rhizophagus irregularis]
MSFGTELKDQVSSVNQFVQSGIHFLNDFRDFVKERAQIEKEYAQKIEALVKKYSSKKDKKALAMTVGDFPKENDTEVDVESSTFLKAWSVILEETDNIAKERAKFSETLSTNVMEKVKTVATRKEEIRKKHMEFAQKLVTDRDKIYSERKKVKTRYDECCIEVQSSQQKLDRSTDDKVLEKQLQELNESRIVALKSIWDDYVNFEISVLEESKNHLDTSLQVINDVDSHIDSELFINNNKRSWEEPADFVFESSPIYSDTEELVDDENSRVYLSNKLSKAKRNLTKLTSEIESKRKEIDGMESLKEAYENNPRLGDSDAVTDNLHRTIREYTTLETNRVKYQTQVESIVEAIGDIGHDQESHDFKNASFTIPTTCDLCQTTIWGIAKQGFTCKDCGYNCHARCEMKVPPICTKEKGKIVKGLVRSETFSNPASPWGTISSMSNYTLSGESAPSILSVTEITEREDVWTAEVLYDHVADTKAELTVSTGDIITVFEPDDGSGWVKAFHNGKEGLVPASYIEYQNLTTDFVKVLYDYESQSPEELTIKEGDVIQVTNKEVAEGWWEEKKSIKYLFNSLYKGILDGITGQFPANYVTPLEE